ncbi:MULTISPECIES: hypothetical protein [unclassified Polaribacter]|uniref:hypothetical protein n=1 Tax=unclassified Polaribacter TaxID=196858 RepID=UPI0011BF1571|nr:MULTISPECIES: hypothetical protein [unclassified Polaribacter]TXD50892.1 hypothetical protein ES043_14280 [Polaribacter sp. IC063]TXD57565.1 hypothetical protein ES044_14660 [Polaribacter sp. IC066]
MINTTVKEGKTAAIISHFWVLGLIIAFVMNNSKKNYFTSFYIRQMIGLNLIQFFNSAIIYRYIGANAAWIIGAIVFVLIILSLFSAIKGEEKELPYVGEYFQKWFKNI